MPTLALTGDVMLGRKVAEAIAERPPEHVWGSALPRLRAAEGLVVNLECVIADGGEPQPGRTFHFRTPPEAVEVLGTAGVDAVSLANNHVLDFGDEALEETIDRLDQAGIEHAGAGRTVDEAWAPARFRVGDQTVGLLAFTDNVPSWSVERRRPGVLYAEIDPQGAQLEAIEREVSTLAQEVDVTIVGPHWGPNMRRQPPEVFQEVAHGLLDAGADILWGHSAHLFQAVERHEDGVVLYDTGDFVDDYRIDPEEHNEISFLFEVHLAGGRVGSVELVPVRIDPRARQVNLADASAASWARERMRELCDPFGTELEATDDGCLRVRSPRSP